MSKIVIHNRIQEWRRRRGLTLEELANKVCEQGLQLTFQQISKLERGAVRLKVEVLAAMAKALQVRSVDLLAPHEGKRLNVIGFVDQGVITLGAPPMGTVACPPGCDPDETEVVEVLDHALGGVVPAGWLLYFHRLKADKIEPDAIGHSAICRLENGQLVVAILRASATPGRWHLIRPYGPPMLDMLLRGATRVRVAIPKDLALIASDEADPP